MGVQLVLSCAATLQKMLVVSGESMCRAYTLHKQGCKDIDHRGDDRASCCRFKRLRKYMHERWKRSSRSNDASSCEIAATLEQSGVNRAKASLGFCFLDLACPPSNVVFHALHSSHKVSFSHIQGTQYYMDQLLHVVRKGAT